jgi:nucleoside-diphosphate-sugar epimerase
MRVLIAGAGGTIGKPLLRVLVGAGDEVVGLTRTRTSAEAIAAAGARPLVVNALDRDALTRAVREAQPEALVHLLTALPKRGPLRGADLNETNRLRREGTANLLAACEAAGVQRLVAESVVFAYGFDDLGERILTEDDQPVETAASRAMRRAQAAVLALEQQALDATSNGTLSSVVLRLGALYGPGVPSSEFMLKLLRRRLMGLPGGGRGVLPWIEIGDVVAAFASALHAGRGILNVVDDESVTVREFLDELARGFATPGPYRLPFLLGRLMMPFSAHLLNRTVLRVSNAKAVAELAWRPAHPTYAAGIRNWAEKTNRHAP